jgi:bacteriocin-like protein
MKEIAMKTHAKANTFGIGRILTDAELQNVSGGETKAQAVAHANDVANAMIAILKKNGVI